MSTIDKCCDSLRLYDMLQLLQAAQAGCRQSLNRLMAAYEAPLRAFIEDYGRCGLSVEEAYQAGREGLWQALLDYPLDSPEPFWSLRWGQGAVGCALLLAGQQQTWHKRRAQQSQTDLTAAHASIAADPAQTPEAQAVAEVLAEMLAALPQRQRQVLVAYYGLDGRPPLTYRQLGREMGYSRTQVWLWQHEALARLSHPSHSYHLRTLLGRQSVAEYLQAQRQVKRWLRRRGGRKPQEADHA